MLNVPVIFDEKKQISSSLVLEMVTKGIHDIRNGLLSVCLYGYFLCYFPVGLWVIVMEYLREDTTPNNQ